MEVAEDLEANFFKHPDLLKYEKAVDQAAIDAGVGGAAIKTDDQYYDLTKEKSMTVRLIKRSDQRKYRPLNTDIRD